MQVAEPANELHRHLLHQVGIHLVVDEFVNFQNHSLQTATVGEDAVAQYFQ